MAEYVKAIGRYKDIWGYEHLLVSNSTFDDKEHTIDGNKVECLGYYTMKIHKKNFDKK